MPLSAITKLTAAILLAAGTLGGCGDDTPPAADATACRYCGNDNAPVIAGCDAGSYLAGNHCWPLHVPHAPDAGVITTDAGP